jgi:hypothetical protein
MTKGFYSTCSALFTPTSASSSVTITGSYGGDSNNAPSAATFSLTVTQRASTTLVICSPKYSVAGSTVTCKAIVVGYRPTGTVTWSQSGTGSVSFGSTACTLSTPTSTMGTCSVTAKGVIHGIVTIRAAYSGDPSNLVSSRSTRITIL